MQLDVFIANGGSNGSYNESIVSGKEAVLSNEAVPSKALHRLLHRNSSNGVGKFLENKLFVKIIELVYRPI